VLGRRGCGIVNFVLGYHESIYTLLSVIEFSACFTAYRLSVTNSALGLDRKLDAMQKNFSIEICQISATIT